MDFVTSKNLLLHLFPNAADSHRSARRYPDESDNPRSNCSSQSSHHGNVRSRHRWSRSYRPRRHYRPRPVFFWSRSAHRHCRSADVSVLFEDDHAHRIDRAVIDSLELVAHIDIFGHQILVVDILGGISSTCWLRYVLIIELVMPSSQVNL